MNIKRLNQDIISQAKSANLIDYMLLNHPEKIMNRNGIRDVEHDSLVLYPHSYCRYSTMESNDSISYLVNYQGYRWRDAVINLQEFAQSSYDKPSLPAFAPAHADRARRFYPPVETDRPDLIIDYLHRERNISLDTIRLLLSSRLVYPATASGYGTDYVCFSNRPDLFFSLRNVSTEGTQKLIFKKESDGFWWFSSLHLKTDLDLWEYLYRQECQFPDSFPLYICESPIDAISLYELTGENGIYIAMCGLKPNTALNAVHRFAIHKEGDPHNHRRTILAVDNDPAGDRFAACFDSHYERITPTGKDWNEDLVQGHRKKDGLPL